MTGSVAGGGVTWASSPLKLRKNPMPWAKKPLPLKLKTDLLTMISPDKIGSTSEAGPEEFQSPDKLDKSSDKSPNMRLCWKLPAREQQNNDLVEKNNTLSNISSNNNSTNNNSNSTENKKQLLQPTFSYAEIVFAKSPNEVSSKIRRGLGQAVEKFDRLSNPNRPCHLPENHGIIDNDETELDVSRGVVFLPAGGNKAQIFPPDMIVESYDDENNNNEPSAPAQVPQPNNSYINSNRDKNSNNSNLNENNNNSSTSDDPLNEMKTFNRKLAEGGIYSMKFVEDTTSEGGAAGRVIHYKETNPQDNIQQALREQHIQLQEQMVQQQMVQRQFVQQQQSQLYYSSGIGAGNLVPGSVEQNSGVEKHPEQNPQQEQEYMINNGEGVGNEGVCGPGIEVSAENTVCGGNVVEGVCGENAFGERVFTGPICVADLTAGCGPNFESGVDTGLDTVTPGMTPAVTSDVTPGVTPGSVGGSFRPLLGMKMKQPEIMSSVTSFLQKMDFGQQQNHPQSQRQQSASSFQNLQPPSIQQPVIQPATLNSFKNRIGINNQPHNQPNQHVPLNNQQSGVSAPHPLVYAATLTPSVIDIQPIRSVSNGEKANEDRGNDNEERGNDNQDIKEIPSAVVENKEIVVPPTVGAVGNNRENSISSCPISLRSTPAQQHRTNIIFYSGRREGPVPKVESCSSSQQGHSLGPSQGPSQAPSSSSSSRRGVLREEEIMEPIQLSGDELYRQEEPRVFLTGEEGNFNLSNGDNMLSGNINNNMEKTQKIDIPSSKVDFPSSYMGEYSERVRARDSLENLVARLAEMSR